jgi:hypothetical protein
MASTFLDNRVRKFKKFQRKRSSKRNKQYAKKYIKSFINDHEIDSIAGSTRAKLKIFEY